MLEQAECRRACIRLTNEDVIDLYARVNVGATVIVLPMDRRADNIIDKRG